MTPVCLSSSLTMTNNLLLNWQHAQADQTKNQKKQDGAQKMEREHAPVTTQFNPKFCQAYNSCSPF